MSFFFFLPLETFARSDRRIVSWLAPYCKNPRPSIWRRIILHPSPSSALESSLTPCPSISSPRVSESRSIEANGSALKACPDSPPTQTACQFQRARSLRSLALNPHAEQPIKSAGASPRPRRSPRGTRSIATRGYALSRFGDPSALTRLRRGYTLSH